MATDVGIKIFLPARFAEEIKNIKQMSFKKAIGTVSWGPKIARQPSWDIC